MTINISKNPDKSIADKVFQAVKDNGGYCPCAIVKTSETKCMCKEFREQETSGFCHCGLYLKTVKEE